MAVTPGQPDALKALRERSQAEGGVFWVNEDLLALFDPRASQVINQANFDDLALPDKLTDQLRGQKSEPFYWRGVRAPWIEQVRELSTAEGLSTLLERMDALLEARAGRSRDWVWVSQEVIAQSLVPVVIDGLGARDTAKVLRDQELKIRFNVEAGAGPSYFGKSLVDTWIQLQAGSVVRRELKGRARGRRPRRRDLTDPIVDLLPELGIGRAVDAVTGVLTAIAGPPGGAAACLVYALVRHPEWLPRLDEELGVISEQALLEAPTRAAPFAHRFVRECLRLWSPTPIVSRPARKDLEHEGVCLHAGQNYLLSPDIQHHDPRHWPDPDVFDPDRWLPGSDRAATASGSYVPFGWSPRGCIGAGLGTAQLILFCWLLRRRFEVDFETPESAAMALPSMPVPQNLRGTLRRK